VPVDSEHSAVLQCLAGRRPTDLARLILTASGGPFRTWGPERVSRATVAEALKHPTWTMGKKITVDSATLVNKALEVIEAHFLFTVPYEQVDVVIHPQSVIHGFVEFVDGSVLAQVGFPTMELPILYALTYPERVPDQGVRRFDPVAAGIFIGSGPWVCKNLSTSVVGNGCTSSGTGTPPPVAGAITLTRFGVGHVPGSSRTDSYMRSNGNQALDIWTGFTGDQTNDGRVESQFSVCFGHTPAQPLGTNTGPTPGTGCGHWEQGIGANGGPLIIGVIQNGIMNRFIYLNWLSPFNTSTNQLTNLVTFPPAVLYEGQYTMRSSSNGCTSAYTSSGIGGYDC